MKNGNRWIRLSAWILAGLFLLGAMGMAGCSREEEPEAVAPVEMAAVETVAVETRTAPLKVAVVGAHSGDLASYGIPTVNAAKLIAEERNQRGGINGRPVELIVEDDQCQPKTATHSATKVVGEDADVVLGHICSGATKAALGIYRDAGLVTLSPSATNPPLTQSGEYPNFFRTIAPDDAQAQMELDFVLNSLGAKKVTVLHDKGDYGKGLAEFAKQFLEQSGKAEVVLYEGITPGAVDYSAIVQKLKRSDAEAVIFGGYHPEASKIVSQMRKKGMEIPFVSDDGVKDDTFIKVAGEYAEGVYATGPVDTSRNPLARHYTKMHEEKFKTGPGAFFLNACAGMLALLNAMEKADSTDYEDIARSLREEYVATPLGIIRFDEKGDAIGVGFSMYQVKNGQYVGVE